MKSRALSLVLSLSMLAAAGCGGPKKEEAAKADPAPAATATPPLPADLQDVAGLTKPRTVLGDLQPGGCGLRSRRRNLRIGRRQR